MLLPIPPLPGSEVLPQVPAENAPVWTTECQPMEVDPQEEVRLLNSLVYHARSNWC